jgi:chromosome partitioning protein
MDDNESIGEGREKREAFVIAFANQKGGVAKTTSVVSLGGALVRREKEVLLVDLDAQANLTLALGNNPGKMRATITDVMFNSATLLSVSRETAIPGLDLVPSNAGMDVAERFLPVRNDFEVILQRAVKDSFQGLPHSQPIATTMEVAEGPGNGLGALHHYDYVILDCPPFMGAVTLNALVAADLLIIPTQTEFFSAHALKTMLAMVKQVRGQYNPDLKYRILITLYDRRNRIHRDVSEQIRSTFGSGVFDTIIEVDTKLRESAVEGLPITHYRNRSRSAEQYDALAQELAQYDG